MRDQNGLSKGSGFVAFSTREEAAQAVSYLPRLHQQFNVARD